MIYHWPVSYVNIGILESSHGEIAKIPYTLYMPMIGLILYIYVGVIMHNFLLTQNQVR